MVDVWIRDLKQNASAVVARVAAGESLTVTVRGAPAARMTPIAASPLQQLINDGQARPALQSPTDLRAPRPGPPISGVLQQMREDERY